LELQEAAPKPGTYIVVADALGRCDRDSDSNACIIVQLGKARFPELQISLRCGSILHVKVGDIFEEIANFISVQLVPIPIGTPKR
jgi:hypothetical protein